VHAHAVFGWCFDVVNCVFPTLMGFEEMALPFASPKARKAHQKYP